MFLQDPSTAEAATEETSNAVADTVNGIVSNPKEGLSMVQGWLEAGKDWAIEEGPGILMKLLMALAIFIIGRIVAKIITGVLRKALNSRKVDSTLVGFLCNITQTGLMVLVVITVLGALEVNTASFAAILAAAGLAVGFALQGSLGNFASGVMIILFRPFKAGDFVEAGGTSGVIVEVGVFATTIKTGDNKKVIVPNGAITDGNIINYSANETRRVDMVFGIGYDDDIKKAKTVLEQVLAADERILKDPAPVIAVSELADSSVNFIVRPWVKTPDYWSVYWDTHETVKLTFDAEGISIPFPQRDVHLHKVEDGAA